MSGVLAGDSFEIFRSIGATGREDSRAAVLMASLSLNVASACWSARGFASLSASGCLCASVRLPRCLCGSGFTPDTVLVLPAVSRVPLPLRLSAPTLALSRTLSLSFSHSTTANNRLCHPQRTAEKPLGSHRTRRLFPRRYPSQRDSVGKRRRIRTRLRITHTERETDRERERETLAVPCSA